ncbi:SpaA isopeptide-forming pilin-related protein, partial [Vagococcus sp.]|uniref:MSCRAMM family protein n=1 Tax=Vagococcus sp. TaxID=1933889 RepID=UPI000EC8E204
LGSYYFLETKAPKGYQLSKEKYTFDIKADTVSQVSKLSVTNKEQEKPKGAVIITKSSSKNSDIVLSGAEFSLYKGNGELVAKELITNELGEVRYDNLEVGDYYVVETKAPTGYEMSKVNYPFEIKAEKTSEIVRLKITNFEKPSRQAGSVELKKVDENNKNIALNGAEFSLYTSAGELLYDKLTTNKEGILEINKLPLGSYYFEETKAPKGYQLSNKKYTFDIKASTVSQVVRLTATNKEKPTPKLGSVILTKVSESDNQTKLPGAEFSLYKSDGTLLNENLVTDESGTLSMKELPLGSYYFEETKAPEGYQLSNKKYTFDIKASTVSQVVRLTATNKEKPTPKLGSVILTKVSENNNQTKLPGAEFSLYKSDGTLLNENLVTDESGTLSMKELPLGSYYFEETKAPEGYQLSNKKYTFDIKADTVSQVVRLTATNKEKPTPKLGSVILTKVSESDNQTKLPGAEFSLYKSDGTLLNENLVTDANGVLEVKELPLGSYYFEETKAPEGYQLSNKKYTFDINEKNVTEIIRMKATNQEKISLGSVLLEKSDTEDSGIKLSNAEFSLYTEDGKLVQANVVTDESGRLQVDNLKEGGYYFVETKAPEGYALSSEKIEFEIKAEQLETLTPIQVTNEKLAHLGAVILTKTDSVDNSVALSGAEFSLYKVSGELIKQNVVTDQNGQLKVSNLMVGDYYFIETKAPKGYELSQEKYSFTIKDSEISEVEQVKVTNNLVPQEPYVGDVLLTKVDSNHDNQVLSGAEFSLYQATGKLIHTDLTTDGEGQLKVENLPKGDYYFKETKAPKGYELSEENYSFTIKENETNEMTQVTVTNKEIPEVPEVPYVGSVMLTKVDESDNEKLLPGAEFSLYTSEGKPIKNKLTTDSNGQLKVENLPKGDYYFKETKAPKGYELSEENYSFTIKENETNEMAQVTVTNREIPEVIYVGGVSLTKVDKNNHQKVLSGAEFSLYTADGKLIKEKLITDEAGVLLVDNLNEGSYYFVETKAPLGYKLSKEKNVFEIKKEQKAEMITLTVTNEPIDIVPLKPIEPTKPVQPVKPIMPKTYLIPNIPSGGQASKTLPKTGEKVDYFGIVGWTMLFSGSYIWWVQKRKQIVIDD